MCKELKLESMDTMEVQTSSPESESSHAKVMPRFVVEGNIGSGKSTLLDYLSSRGFRCYSEDVAGYAPFLERAYRGDGCVDGVQLRVLTDQIMIRRDVEALAMNHHLPVVIERWYGSAQDVFIMAANATPVRASIHLCPLVGSQLTARMETDSEDLCTRETQFIPPTWR